MRIPAQFPKEESKAAFGPPMIDCRKTIATPCPGIITNRAVAKTKDGRFTKRADIFTFCGALLRVRLSRFDERQSC